MEMVWMPMIVMIVYLIIVKLLKGVSIKWSVSTEESHNEKKWSQADW